MGFFKKWRARLHPLEQPSVEKQAVTKDKVTGRASGHVADQIRPPSSENARIESAQRANKLKKQSPIRKSTDCMKVISSRKPSGKSPHLITGYKVDVSFLQESEASVAWPRHTGGKQPVLAPARSRADSQVVAPIGPLRPKATFIYVRREHSWRTTAARFNAIFDAIPSNAAGACRENPKLYMKRRRRALVELGLIEQELIAAPDTPKGKKIMEKLDQLEEEMERERWEAWQREMEGVKRKGDVPAKKLRRKVVMAGPHCVNDARVKLPPVYRKQGGKEKAVIYQRAPKRGERGHGRGKRRAVE
ncbi:hypothetical protein DPSP01_012869 [Paraphaeosphaeria sporulosa]